mmetsp:Transcript_9133/g.13762  ORF Transcript_9133/g.13762 Transcript_9133/m.13762 type:complete len:1191 (+) Transcript_9133:134-3706(+)|eukprot:CAMPEP_0185033310 /NCGR_PEP_ID=MMETSP1103-20130426/22115_1 /TAXON_ID=36769 /ORGANISM="Paraphysomonas bandaiensis, Strain Caron Lab Isolate" /LENGTH=1190 /DNA_ID=CAMNT_0027569529 /DNA_START=51 /DNA_END=3623 /DNA_ORIENTATION=-
MRQTHLSITRRIDTLCAALLFLLVCRNAGAIPTASSEVNALKELYDDCRGVYWNWSNDTTADGCIWNFTGTPNPCDPHSLWQRIKCTIDEPITNSSTYSILQLNLTSFGLDGTLPTTIGLLKELNYLSVTNNSLRATIPSELGYLSNLETLYLDRNNFEGTLVRELGLLVNLVDLDIDNNMLHGSIPSSFGNLTRLEYMDIDNNMLSGTIVSSLMDMSSLVDLDLDKNAFTGTIPETISRLTALKYLSLDTNYFTGSLPSQLGAMTQLGVLLLQNNRFTGHIENLIWQHDLMNIYNLDLSGNRFSGSIPPSLFELPGLEILSLSVNCFSGPLPDTVCLASSAQVMSMYGLSAADSCGYSTVLPYVRAVYTRPFGGTIPECIWSAKQLAVLQLSGNGLRGTLGEIADETAFVNISLTHNELEGTIPRSFQVRNFHELDLSHNKFTGDLLSRFGDDYTMSNLSESSSRIYLDMNRLSGRIPRSLNNVRHIQILSGNLFGCGNQLPRYDPDREVYSCGSALLDYSLIGLCIVFVILLFCVLVFLVVLYGENMRKKLPCVASILQCYRKFYRCISFCEYLSSESLPRLQSFSSMLTQISWGMTALALLGIMFCLPVYVIKALEAGRRDSEYSTHMFLYRWQWSLAYVTGYVPAAVILTSWALLVCVATWVLRMEVSDTSFRSSEDAFRTSNISATSAGSRTSSHARNRTARDSDVTTAAVDGDVVRPVPRIQRVLGCGSASMRFVFNLVVVFTVNAVYIFYIFKAVDGKIIFMLQFLVAGFMLFWNLFVVPSRILSDVDIPVDRVWFTVCYLVFNSIVVPCLATTLTNPSCLKELFVAPDKMTSSYSYDECGLFITNTTTGETNCQFIDHIEITVAPLTPPLTYNSLCSSALVTSYTSVYLYSYILYIVMSIFVYNIAVLYIPRHVSNGLRATLVGCLPGILFPYYWCNTPPVEPPINREYTVSNILLHYQQDQKEVSGLPGAADEGKGYPAYPDDIIRGDRIVAPLLMDAAILLTFGMCSPFLAVAIVAAVHLKVLKWKALLGRFILLRINLILQYDVLGAAAGDIPKRVKVQSEAGYCDVMGAQEVVSGIDNCMVCLEDALADMHEAGSKCLWLQVCLGAVFFGMLCWEIAADRYGWADSVWIPVCAVAVPLLLLAYCQAFPTNRVVFEKKYEEESPMTLSHSRLQVFSLQR